MGTRSDGQEAICINEAAFREGPWQPSFVVQDDTLKEDRVDLPETLAKAYYFLALIVLKRRYYKPCTCRKFLQLHLYVFIVSP